MYIVNPAHSHLESVLGVAKPSIVPAVDFMLVRCDAESSTVHESREEE
jgi:hypothetical protein